MNSFNEFQLPAPISQAIARLGFEIPTPIQIQAIPLILSGKDLIGCAQTGTGKTAAYCIPILDHFLKNPQGLGLVLVPTRELARQVEEFWIQLAHGRALGCVSLIGGVAISPQVRALRHGPRLVIATPGRLIDHLMQKTITLSRLTFLVLDEADRMLDMGFEPQLSRIAKFVPVQRQTLLFSATMPPEAQKLSAKFVKNPALVTVGENSRTADKVAQSVMHVEIPRKNDALLDEINRWQKDSILIFARTKSRTDRVARYLNEYGLNVARIHGGRSQAQRNSAISDFKAGKARIMVATDIAARGIDVASVGFVINYDLPQVPEDYVHRIGRTGRAGAVGEAVSLVTHEERLQWRAILGLLKKTGSPTPVTREQVAAHPGTNRPTVTQPAPRAEKRIEPRSSGGRPSHHPHPAHAPHPGRHKPRGRRHQPRFRAHS